MDKKLNIVKNINEVELKCGMNVALLKDDKVIFGRVEYGLDEKLVIRSFKTNEIYEIDSIDQLIVED